MAEIPDRFLVHRAAVLAVVGHDAVGEVLAESVDFPCFIAHRRRLVRGANGDEVVSEATLSAKLDVLPYLSPESQIVLHTEAPGLTTETGTVLGVSPHVDGGMGVWQHVEAVV